MEALVDNGQDWLEPLLDFRQYLAETGDPDKKHQYRDIRGRDGRVIFKKDGTLAARTYKLEASQEMLRRLLRTEQQVRRDGPDPEARLIGDDEILEIRRLWRTERQDWDDMAPQIFREVTGTDLAWPQDDNGGFDGEQKALLGSICKEYDVPLDLVARLLELERQSAGMARRAGVPKEIADLLGREWRSEEELLALNAQNTPDRQIPLNGAHPASHCFRSTMQLLSLRVENFGLFRGAHFFDLAAPCGRAERPPNLTVFVGHNGAGKSTLFQAIAVALHGTQALGDKVSAAQYNDFLYGHMHRHKERSKTAVSTEASVALSFGLCAVRHPAPCSHVTRRWQRNGRAVSETLEVLQDSQLLATEAADAQAWINDLLPPGMARLCFFDAEDLDALAGADQRNPPLGEALQRLLGLDLIQRAQADLRAYILKARRQQRRSTICAMLSWRIRPAWKALTASLRRLTNGWRKLADEEATVQGSDCRAGAPLGRRRWSLCRPPDRSAGALGSQSGARSRRPRRRSPTKPLICCRLPWLPSFAADWPRVSRRKRQSQREQVAQTLFEERLTQIETSLRRDLLGRG